MGLVYIYVIKSPLSNLVHYVGKTCNPEQRFRKHLTYKRDTKCARWIKGLLNRDLKPLFEIIDIADSSDWKQKERHYILLFRSFGANLLNQLPGGEGGATMLGKTLTELQRSKISNSKLGKQRPDLSLSNKKTKGTKVLQILEGHVIAEFDSINDAARAVNRSSRRIQMMINGKGKKVNHVGGYQFYKK